MQRNKNAFRVDFNLKSSVSHEELSQKLKTNGSDVIQTSSGICFKTEKKTQELSEILATEIAAGIMFQSVKLGDAGLALDVKAFFEDVE
ncbi:MAG: hypothetical protein H7326_12005 [Bdellovibrionaceae bacterium]|nr:hypothetical protein [Pseudobdellovibrionaceae bacterium]